MQQLYSHIGCSRGYKDLQCITFRPEMCDGTVAKVQLDFYLRHIIQASVGGELRFSEKLLNKKK